jgi:glycosyltransferase involved in cell wall biosynthesis
VRRLLRRRPAGPPVALVFLSGRAGATRRYRCDHQAEQYAWLGARVKVVAVETADLGRLIADPPGGIVLHRVPWDEEIGRFATALADRRVPVLFDTDDLIFDPSLAEYAPISATSDNGLERQRLAMEKSCGVTVSTGPLARHAAAITPHVAVLPNVVSSEMVIQADRARGLDRSRGREELAIGYLSGTPYHDENFLQAADAVLWALAAYPHTTFVAAGRLNLDSRFDGLGERVRRIPMRPWDQLPELIATLAVNLAPLDPNSPFSECKSCVKYLEAALVGVPTVASPRPDFARVVIHGANGLLADSQHEWREALRRLIETPALRSELGQRAWEDVRTCHTSGRAAGGARAAMTELLGGRPGALPLRIEWIVAHMPEDVQSTLAAALAERGHDVTVRATAGRPRSPQRLRHGKGYLAVQHGEHDGRFDISIGEEAVAPENSRGRFTFVYGKAELVESLPPGVFPILSSADEPELSQGWSRPVEVAADVEALEKLLQQSAALLPATLGAADIDEPRVLSGGERFVG